MTNPTGSFIWYELISPDPDASAAFYGAVVGWTISAQADPSSGGIDYRMIVRDDGGMAGGVLRLTEEMAAHGGRPAWLPYFYAPDIDAQVSAIVAEGGTVLMPATDMPPGRIAMVLDPQGVPIYLMKPTPPPGKPDATSDVFDEHALQRVSWNELASPDPGASLDFYARQFGLVSHDKMPMGPMGDYAFLQHDGRQVGAIMRQQSAEQPALWLLYFSVPSIALAKNAIEANGGQVTMGPHEVPGGMWIVVGQDPQGALFGVVSASAD